MGDEAGVAVQGPAEEVENRSGEDQNGQGSILYSAKMQRNQNVNLATDPADVGDDVRHEFSISN